MHAKLRSAPSCLGGADAIVMQSFVGEELAQGPYVCDVCMKRTLLNAFNSLEYSGSLGSLRMDTNGFGWSCNVLVSILDCGQHCSCSVLNTRLSCLRH